MRGIRLIVFTERRSWGGGYNNLNELTTFSEKNLRYIVKIKNPENVAQKHVKRLNFII